MQSGSVSVNMKVEHIFLSFVDGDDEDLMGVANSPLRQAPSSLLWSSDGRETREQFYEQRKGDECMEKFQCYNNEIFTVDETSMSVTTTTTVT